jgi:hypothetical protein
VVIVFNLSVKYTAKSAAVNPVFNLQVKYAPEPSRLHAKMIVFNRLVEYTARPNPAKPGIVLNLHGLNTPRDADAGGERMA